MAAKYRMCVCFSVQLTDCTTLFRRLTTHHSTIHDPISLRSQIYAHTRGIHMKLCSIISTRSKRFTLHKSTIIVVEYRICHHQNRCNHICSSIISHALTQYHTVTCPMVDTQPFLNARNCLQENSF